MGPSEDLGTLLDLLDEQEIEHMVVGALAMDALGVPRTTVDIDVQVRLTDPLDPHPSHFHGLFIEERSHDEVFDQETLILVGRTGPYPLELFLTSHWFTGQALDRRQRIRSALLDREVPLPTPEDFILLKAAYWQHPSRSKAKAAQDGVDIETVVESQTDALDTVYLRDNAERLGIWQPLAGLLDPLL